MSKLLRLPKHLPKKGEKGFTLIELIVVIAILGILAAIIVPNFSTWFGAGTEEAKASEQKILQTAVYAAMAEVGEPKLDLAEGEIITITVTDSGVMINPDPPTAGGKPIDIGDYIAGGLDALQYSWKISEDGVVTEYTPTS